MPRFRPLAGCLGGNLDWAVLAPDAPFDIRFISIWFPRWEVPGFFPRDDYLAPGFVISVGS